MVDHASSERISMNLKGYVPQIDGYWPTVNGGYIVVIQHSISPGGGRPPVSGSLIPHLRCSWRMQFHGLSTFMDDVLITGRLPIVIMVVASWIRIPKMFFWKSQAITRLRITLPIIIISDTLSWIRITIRMQFSDNDLCIWDHSWRLMGFP